MDFVVLTAAGKGALLRKAFPAGWNWVRGPLSLIAVCKYSGSFRFVVTLSVHAPASASVGAPIMILFVRLTVWPSTWLSNWLFVSVWLFNYRTKVPRKKRKMQFWLVWSSTLRHALNDFADKGYLFLKSFFGLRYLYTIPDSNATYAGATLRLILNNCSFTA